MNEIINSLLNKWVLLYLAIVVIAQFGLVYQRRYREHALRQKRRNAGLKSDDIFLNHAQRLQSLRNDAVIEAGLLVGTVIVTPFILVFIVSKNANATAATGLATTFLLLLLWVLFSNSDIGKAWLGGTLFKLLVGFKAPFQVGDRVTLLGFSGKVLEIGSLLIKLQTVDDDLVSIPTNRLWSEPLVSANAGDRASMCVIPFYLTPTASSAQRQGAEDAIWAAVQGSIYFDFAKPMQIYVAQQKNAIVLTVKAYVASTYIEPLFKSDITRTFLDYSDKHQLPLAVGEWNHREPGVSHTN